MQGENLVDMESFGVHFVCQKEKIPFLICKRPFDIVSPDSKKIDIWEITRQMETFPLETVWQKIESFLAHRYTNSVPDITPLANKHRLTWSEAQMLQFAVNRAIARGKKQEDLRKELDRKTTSELRVFYTESS